jgi:DNA primase
VMVFQTTTREQTDQEFLSRCIELCADESEAQTGRIHDAQRRAFSLDSIVRQGEKPWIERVHRNAQRLLKPLPVRIPFVDELRFPKHRMQLRRDNPKYLSLIESCAVLHQFQRRVHEVITEAGEVVQYIEATVADLEVANQLAVRIWGCSLDGLSARARQFLEELHTAVVEACGQLKLAQEEFWFSARWVRERMDMSPTRVKAHLAALAELELLRVHRPAKGVQGALYELDWHGEGLDGERFVAGLTDLEAVRRKFGGPSTTMTLWSACGPPVVRGVSGSGPVVVHSNTPHVNAEKHHLNGNAGRKGLPAVVPVAG